MPLSTCLICEFYACLSGWIVTDFTSFGGEVLPLNILLNKDQWHKLDLPAFQERQDKPIREPEILRMARFLSSKYQRLGVIGFCYGAWGAFRLGNRNQKLVDCLSVAHPSRLEKEEIENVGVPVQILAPEFDPAFTEEMKTFSWQKIPALGVALDYQHFPGVEHGFAVRGDPGNPKERKAMERAKDAAVGWFYQWLHRDTE